MQNLLELAKYQTASVENENWEYYYQADEYKFNNVYLANWYERTHNSRATFVAQPYHDIKKKLKTEVFDKNKNYSLEFLKKLRSENDYLQLFFSGGVDSYTTFKTAIDNDIYIDELIAVATGDSLDLKENFEIYENAIPLAEKHKGTYGKFTVKQITLDHSHKIYKDPYCLFKYPETGAIYPYFRRMWNEFEPAVGVRIIGPEKPQLLYYKSRWYLFLLDTNLNGFYAIQPKLTWFGFDYNNIFSIIQEGLLYRDYILEYNKIDNNMSFFKISTDHENRIIGRNSIPKKQYDKYHKNGLSIWNYKDEHAFKNLIDKQKLSLLLDYYKSIDKLLETYPDYNYKTRELSPAKFGWFIDIDSLEIYTQQELIPTGFEV